MALLFISPTAVLLLLLLTCAVQAWTALHADRTCFEHVSACAYQLLIGDGNGLEGSELVPWFCTFSVWSEDGSPAAEMSFQGLDCSSETTSYVIRGGWSPSTGTLIVVTNQGDGSHELLALGHRDSTKPRPVLARAAEAGRSGRRTADAVRQYWQIIGLRRG
jgi:hypothetical protein